MTSKKISELSGVGPATEQKLAEAGYLNLLSIAVASIPELVEASGLSEKQCRKLTQEARNSLNLGFEEAEKYEERKENSNKLSMGLQVFDEMLGGGVELGSITEFYGEWGAGKSQLCFLLSASVQEQYPGSQVIYLDTEGSFRGNRIKDFAEGFGLDKDEVLKNVKVARVYSVDHQMIMIDKVEEMINDGTNVKLLVIDSITSLFRAEYQARGTLATRQQKLNKHLHSIMKIADMYDIAVVITNQVMSRPDVFYGDPIQAIGGHILGHASSTRVYLRKATKGSRTAKLVDSPHLPDGECNYFVSSTKIEPGAK
jgi:DNA repair protein RadA